MQNSNKRKSIILVRHGETDWNIINRIQGHIDVPLNEKGIKQARKIANDLAEEKIDKIYSSPLKRAYDTADIINEYHNLDIESTVSLAEIDQGKWNRLTVKDARKKYPVRYKKWQENPLAVSPPGGETILFVSRRLKIFLEEIRDNNYKNILIISHKVSCAILKILIEKRPDKLKEIKEDLLDLWNRLFENIQVEKITIN